MRPLTKEEKAQSQAAKKKANQQLQLKQREIGLKLKFVREHYGFGQSAAERREELLHQFDMLKDVKGYPVIVSLEGKQIILDYELLRRLYRTLKNRHKNVSMDSSSGSTTLVITHHANLWGKDKGSMELFGIPPHKAELLTDLPVITIDS